MSVASSSAEAVSAKSQTAGLQEAKNAVLVQSGSVPAETPVVRGYDFNEGLNYDKLLQSMFVTGYQATHLGRAINIVNDMIRWKLSDDPMTQEEIDDEARGIVQNRSEVKVTKFLGYTSNLISSGLRESIRYLCQHKMIDAIVTTAGGIEEDFIKCMMPTYVGEFTARGADLRSQGMNRIGNLVVPNQNYVAFESWLTPILDTMLEEQKAAGAKWTPSKIIRRLGKEINHPDSVYYWCYKNDIPVFCPAITDGSLGDMMFFHSLNKPGLVIDILEDLREVNLLAMSATKSGAIILGGGIVKHHICNANLMRNGTDYAVYINTAQEFDGSDAGASPDEAVSWGKIKGNACSVKVCGDATILFPLLVAQTFAKMHEQIKKEKANEKEKEAAGAATEAAKAAVATA